MSSTTAALVARIRDRVDPPERRRYGDDVIVRSALNPASRHFHERVLGLSATGSIDVAAGVADYALPAAIPALYAVEAAVWTATGSLLKKTTRGQALEWNLSGGAPEWWYLWEGRFWVVPAPAAAALGAISLNAYGGPPPYSEVEPAPAAVEVVIPTHHEDAVVEDAVYRLARIDHEEKTAADAAAEYGRLTAVIQRERNPDRRPRQRRDASDVRRLFF